jgi:hypothetical protein
VRSPATTSCRQVVKSICVRSPIGLHDASQVAGTPLFEPDRYVIKFHNLWTVEAPDGYALPFTHPVNRFDLSFTTLTDLVDSDRYYDNWIHFPAHWHDLDFKDVLPKGTPVAQCIPVKREKLGGAHGVLHARGNAARARPLKRNQSRDRHLPPAIPRLARLHQLEKFQGFAERQDEATMRSGGERHMTRPLQCRCGPNCTPPTPSARLRAGPTSARPLRRSPAVDGWSRTGQREVLIAWAFDRL